MFRFQVPDEDAQRRLQADEAAFYWSRCAPGWFRKHGLVGHVGAEDVAIVLRRTILDAPPAGAALIEGPLAPRTARALALTVAEHRVEGAALELAGPLPAACPPPRLLYPGVPLDTFGCARLQYPRFTVKAIPLAKDVPTAPEPFAPADPRHAVGQFACQTFDLARSDGRWRPLMVAHALAPAATPAEHYGVVAVTDGRHLVLGVPLLDLFGAMAQMPPMPVAYLSSNHDLDAEWLQEWLAAAIVGLATDAGGTVVRTRRWPHGRTWALSMRVDYDRLLSDAELHAYLDLAARYGIRMSWQFLSTRTIPRQAAAIAARGHEIALHTEARSLEAFRAEIDFVARETGTAVTGSSAHGGMGSMGYSGDLRIGWSEALGLAYCETLAHVSLAPHRFNRVVDDLPVTVPLMAPAPHRGLDLGMAPDAHMLERYIVRDVPWVRAYGGHFPLMHHPDIHVGELATLLAAIDYDGCWHATLEEVVRWADTLHYGGTVSGANGRIEFAVPGPLAEPAVIEALRPDGTGETVLPVGSTRTTLPVVRS